MRQLIIVVLLMLAGPIYAASDGGTDAKVTVLAKVLEPAAKAPAAGAGTAATSAPKAVDKPAVDAEPQAWWQALVYDVVFKVVVPIFLPVLMALLYWLVRKIGLHIELKTLDSVGEKAAMYAEKKGAAFLRENGQKSAAATKEGWAFDLAEAIDAKLLGKKKARDKLRAIILGKIPAAEKAVAEAETAKNGNA